MYMKDSRAKDHEMQSMKDELERIKQQHAEEKQALEDKVGTCRREALEDKVEDKVGRKNEEKLLEELIR